MSYNDRRRTNDSDSYCATELAECIIWVRVGVHCLPQYPGYILIYNDSTQKLYRQSLSNPERIPLGLSMTFSDAVDLDADTSIFVGYNND